MKWLIRGIPRWRLLVYAVFLPLFTAGTVISTPWKYRNWRTADRGSSGISPAPEAEKRAVVQLFAARVFSWRGVFGVHPWIAVKPEGAKAYKVLHVVGWRLYRNGTAVVVEEDLPDRKWYGRPPELLLDLRGGRAAELIPLIEKAASSYPYPKTYRTWPGPNSNTFVSHILRETPGLGVELPPTAIGRDWLGLRPFARSETGTGFQVSLFGLAGFTVGLKDGLEVNLLGFCFGVDLLRPALKLPMAGRIGLKDS